MRPDQLRLHEKLDQIVEAQEKILALLKTQQTQQAIKAPVANPLPADPRASHALPAPQQPPPTPLKR